MMDGDLGNLADLLGDDFVPVGYVVCIKALDADGDVTFVTAERGVNMMEALGMSQYLRDHMQDYLQSGARALVTGDDDEDDEGDEND